MLKKLAIPAILSIVVITLVGFAVFDNSKVETVMVDESDIVRSLPPAEFLLRPYTERMNTDCYEDDYVFEHLTGKTTEYDFLLDLFDNYDEMEIYRDTIKHITENQAF